MLLELGGVRLLTDPVLRPGFAHIRRHAAPPAPAVSEHVDAVLISHLHLDHLDLASLRSLDGSFRLLVPQGAGAFLRAPGVRPGRGACMRRVTRRGGCRGGGNPRGSRRAPLARDWSAGGSDRIRDPCGPAPSTSPATPTSSREWTGSSRSSTWHFYPCGDGAPGSVQATSIPGGRPARRSCSGRASRCRFTGAPSIRAGGAWETGSRRLRANSPTRVAELAPEVTVRVLEPGRLLALTG